MLAFDNLINKVIPVTLLTLFLVASGCSTTTSNRLVSDRAHDDFADGKIPIEKIYILNPKGQVSRIYVSDDPMVLSDFTNKLRPELIKEVVRVIQNKGYSTFITSNANLLHEEQLISNIEEYYKKISSKLYNPNNKEVSDVNNNIDIALPAEALNPVITKDADAILYINYIGINRSMGLVFGDIAINSLIGGAMLSSTGVAIVKTRKKNLVYGIALLLDAKDGKLLWSNLHGYGLDHGRVSNYTDAITWLLTSIPVRGGEMYNYVTINGATKNTK